MRVERDDGTVTIEQNVDEERIRQALADKRNVSVQVFQPGREVTRSNGRTYRMNNRGQWVRVK